MTTVWQIAAGGRCRDYTNLFLEHDVMFIGPGNAGSYNANEYAKSHVVKRFAEKMQTGDIVLLRNGYKVIAVGVVDGSSYAWNKTFDDVYGWDLQHTRRVVWQNQLKNELESIQVKKHLFGDRKQIPRFTAVKDRSILEPIEHLFSGLKARPLKDLPHQPPPPLNMDELGQELFSKGLPNESVDKVIVAINRQRRLIKWYLKSSKISGRPTEHEVVAHMILPLLLALGWSEQLLGVEWNKIDLAAFSNTPTTEEQCVLVCEAKVLWHGLQDTFTQAIGYVEKLKLNKCRKILLTDGVRLYLYQKNTDWSETPVGYLNVELIRTNHITPPNTNAVDTIMALTPAGIGRKIGN